MDAALVDGGPADRAVGAATPLPLPLPPMRSRWLVATLLVLVALVGVVMWGLLTVQATDATAENFARSELPGALTADLHPGVWDVHVEGPAAVERVTVAHPDGRRVAVTRVDGGGTSYDHHGFTATRVASFTLPRGGEWPGMRVEVEGTPGDAGTTFAVGAADELSSIGVQRWGMLALLVVNVGAAIAIVVVPIVRRRRNHRPAPVTQPGPAPPVSTGEAVAS